MKEYNPDSEWTLVQDEEWLAQYRASNPKETCWSLHRDQPFRAGPVVAYQERALNMLHWLESLLPQLPHYGYVLVLIVVFLNNIGVPIPGETILLGAGLGTKLDVLDFILLV